MTATAVEHDGDHHRSPGQWRADLARREAVEALGWGVVVVTAALRSRGAR